VNVSEPAQGWTTSRLVLGALVLTLAQAAVVSRVGRVPTPITRPPAAALEAWLVWDPVLVDEAFAGVPQSRLDIFGRDPLDAFQKVAVSALPPPRYRSTEWREPTLWLTNPVSWSGIRPVPPVVGTVLSDSTRPAFPQSGVRNLAPTNTFVEVTGDLVSRASEDRSVDAALAGDGTVGEHAIEPGGESAGLGDPGQGGGIEWIA